MGGRSKLPGDSKLDELKELNEELENFFQSTIIPQLFFDKNLILRKYSPAAIEQFNLSESSIGKHLKDLSNNMRYQTLEDDIMSTISNSTIIEKEIQTQDDKWYRMNVIPYRETKKKTTNGVIITFVDINNYVLNLKELQKLNADHETFIYTVSHDLKAPLNNIEGLIDELKKSSAKDKPEEMDQIISMLNLSTARMKDMINELANIIRSKAKDEEIKKPVSFIEIYSEVYLTLKEQIDESHAKIESSFEVSEIYFQRKDLRSLIYNLLSNAIKYKAEDRSPVIEIKTQKQNDYILLSVKDNGRGIEEDKKAIIFSEFTRLTNKVEGSGIGLFLVSRIVNGQGGKIIVNSEVNHGSEFLIYLKIKP
jgi:two-component system, OmpR family, phosphate regulon sensor histidine kinase PhoR